MPDQILWASSVLGLCFWHEADDAGQEGYRCVADLPEELAIEFAAVLNELGVSSPDSVVYLIKLGVVFPTKESLEDALVDGLVQYPITPGEESEVTSGDRIEDFPWSACEIAPRADVSLDDKVGIKKIKPKEATKKLLSQLDKLAGDCQRYDKARQQGKKNFEPNWPPTGPRGHQNLLGALLLMRNHIGYQKGWIMAMLQEHPFLAGDLRPGDRELLTVPDAEGETVAKEEVFADPPAGAEVPENEPEAAESLDDKIDKLIEKAARIVGLPVGPSDAAPAMVNLKVPMSGKALKVILNAAAAKPGKEDPDLPIHSVGIGDHSIVATDQYKVVIVGKVENSYKPTIRKEALVEAASCEIRGEFVHWDQIDLMKPKKEGEDPPRFPDVAKLAKDVEGMVDVGSFSPTLLGHVAKIAEALGASEVKLFRSRGKTSYLGFSGKYWPSEQLDLFSGNNDEVSFQGLLCGRTDRELEVEDVV
jgi:hypothetical protein